MADNRSEKEQEARKKDTSVMFSLLFLAGGVSIVIGAAFLGQFYDLGVTLVLDLSGERQEGRIERRNDDRWRISYQHPETGQIHARTGEARIGIQRIQGDNEPVMVRYSTRHPEQFQVEGISYLPALGTASLFLFGMALVLYSRRMLRSRYSRK